MLNIDSRARLNNGVEMPWVGLGVYKTGPDVVENAVHWAVEAGYRHIDTAMYYDNEEGVGRAVKSCGIDREEVFVTTKLWNTCHGYEAALAACDDSLRRLDMDYVDLYLVHWPGPDDHLRVETWRAMIRILEEGKARAIGVSNFENHHVDKLIAATGVVPAVNQVELHPLLSQKSVLKYSRDKDIRVTAWGPLMHSHLADAPAKIDEIAAAHGKSRAQVILRWHLQNGVIVIPKSVNRERIRENISLFDFELTAGEMAVMDGLNTGARYGGHPDTFDLDF